MLPDKLLPHDVTVYEPDYPSGGGRSPKYVEIAQVKARVQKLSGGLRETVLGQFPNATHLMFLNPGSGIKPNCKVTCGSEQYKVLNVDDWFGHHTEAILEQMAG